MSDMIMIFHIAIAVRRPLTSVKVICTFLMY